MDPTLTSLDVCVSCGMCGECVCVVHVHVWDPVCVYVVCMYVCCFCGARIGIPGPVDLGKHFTPELQPSQP